MKVIRDRHQLQESTLTYLSLKLCSMVPFNRILNVIVLVAVCFQLGESHRPSP